MKEGLPFVPRLIITHAQESALVESAVPDAFRAGLKEALGGPLTGESYQAALRKFFERFIEWGGSQLGLHLKENECHWLADVLAKSGDLLSAEKALVELLHEASAIPGKIERGLRLEQLGNQALLASGGFLERNHGANQRYYADQATEAYGEAGVALNHPILLQIVYGDRVPLLSHLVRLLRVLGASKDPLPVFEFVQKTTHRDVTTCLSPEGRLAGSHLRIIK